MISKNLLIKADDAAEFLMLLGNAKRLAIMAYLLEGEMTVGSIAKKVALSQSALSQHLAKLRSLDLVDTRRDRQMIYYSCRSDAVQRLFLTLGDIFAENDLRPRAPVAGRNPELASPTCAIPRRNAGTKVASLLFVLKAHAGGSDELRAGRWKGPGSGGGAQASPGCCGALMGAGTGGDPGWCDSLAGGLRISAGAGAGEPGHRHCRLTTVDDPGVPARLAAPTKSLRATFLPRSGHNPFIGP